MPKGMVVKNKPPVRDKTGKRVLVQMVGDFTDAELKRLVKEGTVVPMETKIDAAAKTSTDSTNDGAGAKAAGDKAPAADTSDAGGNKAGSGSRKAL